MANATGTEERATKAGEQTKTNEKQPPRRKRHRLRRWLAAGLVLIILLVALLPTLLSTGAGRGLILSIVNKQIRGTAQADDISLGWFTPCKLTGLSVSDPDGRPVLTVESVAWDRGLLRGLWPAMFGQDYGQVTVQKPQANLHFRDDWSVSLADAFQPRTPAKPQTEPSKPAKTSIVLSVVDSGIRADRADGRHYTPLGQVNISLALRSMNDLTASLSGVEEGGGKLTVSASAKDFYVDGKFTLKNITAKWKLSNDPVDLKPASGFALDNAQGGGTVAFNSEGEFTAGKGDASYSIALKRAWAAEGKAAGGQPPTTQIDGELKGKIALDSGVLNLDSNLANSTLGSFQASLRYALDSGPLAVTLPQLLAVLTDGTPIELPDFTLKANGKLDPVAISQAAPALLKGLNLRPDVLITAGSLDLNDIQVSGPKPEASGSLQFSLTSERIASGGAENLAAGLAPPASARQATARQATARQAGRLNVMQPIIIAFNISTDANGKMNVEQAEMSSSFGNVDVKGELPKWAGTAHIDLDKAHEEFNQFLNMDNVAMTGTLDIGQASAAPASMVPAGTSWKTDLGVDLTANNLFIGTVPATAKGSHVTADRSAAPALAANFSPRPVIRLADYTGPSPSAPPPATNAPTNAPAPAPATGQQAAISGHLKLNWSMARLDSGQYQSAGKIVIDKCSVAGLGDVLGPQQSATISHDLTYDQAGNKLGVGDCAINSNMLTADIKGGISDLTSQCLLDLSGDYTAQWPQLMALLGRIAPSAATQLRDQGVNMLGDSAGNVKVGGPIRNPSASGQVSGDTGVGWGPGSKAFGLVFGKALFSIEYKDGRITLKQGTTTANDGTLNVSGMVDASGNDPLAGPGRDPVLNINGELTVLDKVTINPEVGKLLLSRALPLLADTSQLTGSVSLVVRDVHLPLSGRIMQVGSGSGRLDLSAVRLQPTGEMAKLMSLLELGASQSYPIKVSAFDFALKDGALTFHDLTITLGELLDLTFRGSVRFDDTVDITVSVPIRPELLGAVFKTAGLAAPPVAELAKALNGVRVDIPLTGTRQAFKLDLSKVNAKNLLDQAIKNGFNPANIQLPKLPGPEVPKLPSLPTPELPKLPAPKLPELPKP